MAQYVELSMDQGTSFGVDITVIKDDGSPRNVANSTFTCSIRKSYYSSSPTANLITTTLKKQRLQTMSVVWLKEL
jgi:hypothetical protein